MSEEKKGIYHSELVRLGEIDAEVLSDVVTSKFGRNPWVALRINGRERTYTTENERCAEALDGLKGKTVHLMATGSREEADIHTSAPRQTHTEAQVSNAAAKALSKTEAKEIVQLDAIEYHAEAARQIGEVAWKKATELMKLIPDKDAKDIGVEAWYDMVVRQQQGIKIYVERKLG